MSLEQIIAELKKLNHEDKLRVMQALVAAISSEEEAELPSYELLTPYGNEEAARILYEVLQAVKANDET